MSKPLCVGDVVRLKSGGPAMTITRLFKTDVLASSSSRLPVEELMASCTWFALPPSTALPDVVLREAAGFHKPSPREVQTALNRPLVSPALSRARYVPSCDGIYRYSDFPVIALIADSECAWEG